MPRNYVRKTNRQSWSHESMAAAISEVLEGRMGYRRASASFNVPQSTLEDRVKKARQKNLSAECAAEKRLGRFHTVFSEAQEREIVEHILLLEERLFGLTLHDLRKFAFELAEKNGVPHTFNQERKMAGKEWLYSFLRRHPQLSLRNPEKTSLARAKGFNRVAVGKFYDLLESIYEKHNISPSDIYNVDETGILTVPNKPSKVLALRGKKQVGCLSSAERGVLVTVETCMNAAGNFVPPMFVFPRKRNNPMLMDDAPPGSSAYFHESGWINAESFIAWFQRFVTYANPSQAKPVLLILDGHASHTKSLALLNMAREKHVILLCFPPHTTHRLQPLDVSFMAPLSTYYEQEVRKWMIANPGRAITIYQVAKLFTAAYTRAAIMKTAIKGFEKTGIHPCNRDIFPDHLYAPADTTERPEPVANPTEVDREENDCSGQNDNESSTRKTSKIDTPLKSIDQCNPVETSMTNIYLNPQPSTSSGSSPFSISPRMMMPPPQELNRKPQTKSRRKKGKTAILTSSPYKTELEMEQEEKEKNQKKKNLKRKVMKTTDEDNQENNENGKKKNIKNQPKPNKCESTSSKQEQDEENANKKKRGEKGNSSGNKKMEFNVKIHPKKKKFCDTTESTSEEEDDDEACLFCNELYTKSKAKEGWIQCNVCAKWAHEACSNAEEDDDSFTCDFCSEA